MSSIMNIGIQVKILTNVARHHALTSLLLFLAQEHFYTSIVIGSTHLYKATALCRHVPTFCSGQPPLAISRSGGYINRYVLIRYTKILKFSLLISVSLCCLITDFCIQTYKIHMCMLEMQNIVV